MENSTTKTARKPRAKKVETPLFNKLSALNVNKKTENRNGYTYLSWAWAWAEFKKQCPDAQYEIIKDAETGKLYSSDQFGIMVQTRVTTGGNTHEMWLPVMDNSNNAQKTEAYQITFRSGKSITVAPATMMDINKSIMRCLVKNLAMFGLGIYIYAGEDLPMDDQQTPDPVVPKPAPKKQAPKTPVKNKINSERFDKALNAIKDGKYHEDDLRKQFALTKAQENTLVDFLQSQIAQANEIKKSLNK